MKPLKVDPVRFNELADTGIKFRALNGDKWVTCDLSDLDKESVEEWLSWLDEEQLVNTILIMLGHRE